MFPSQIFEAEIQNFYVRASALPQLFIPESLSILAQTICSSLNFFPISRWNYIWPPCKSKIRLRNVNIRYTHVFTFLRVLPIEDIEINSVY